MDTDGLASGLSLAAWLLVFTYLSMAENAIAAGNVQIRPSGYLSPLLFTFKLLRLASVAAIVLSAQSLVLSQGSPGVALISVVALALIAFLLILDRVSKLFSNFYPGAASTLISPLRFPFLPLVKVSRRPLTVSGETTAKNSTDRNGEIGEPLDQTTVVITEEEQAGLDNRGRLMIRSILSLEESTAREVMVPRVDIIAVEVDTPLSKVASRMLECGHSRLPVYSETIDNIVGVVYSRDLLPLLTKSAEYPPLEKIMRPAFFIPESKRLDELLRELQEKRVQMAMVVDEYGGIEGLVTLEDLLEEIVGEIEDEFSRGLEPRVVPMANGDIIVDARVTLDYLSDLFATPIGNEDVDTVGGLVYSCLGKMPQVGDEILHNGLRIEVLSLLGRRIRRLKLSRTETHKAE